MRILFIGTKDEDIQALMDHADKKIRGKVANITIDKWDVADEYDLILAAKKAYDKYGYDRVWAFACVKDIGLKNDLMRAEIEMSKRIIKCVFTEEEWGEAEEMVDNYFEFFMNDVFRDYKTSARKSE